MPCARTAFVQGLDAKAGSCADAPHEENAGLSGSAQCAAHELSDLLGLVCAFPGCCSTSPRHPCPAAGIAEMQHCTTMCCSNAQMQTRFWCCCLWRMIRWPSDCLLCSTCPMHPACIGMCYAPPMLQGLQPHTPMFQDRMTRSVPTYPCQF